MIYVPETGFQVSILSLFRPKLVKKWCCLGVSHAVPFFLKWNKGKSFINSCNIVVYVKITKYSFSIS